MAFDGTEGARITLSEGAALTAEYRRQNNGAVKAHFIGKDLINDILAQSDCMGLRIYYGLDSNGDKQLVIVGADSNEDDILDIIVDHCEPCPTNCSNSNALNS
jgi:hypothetical protein